MDLGDRKWIIGLVREGSKSRYWELLRGQILEWISEEESLLNSFKKIGIRDSDDRGKYNRAVDRMEYLKRMLMMNETIISYNQNLLDKIRDVGEKAYEKTESFINALGGKNAR